ncbi:MAG: hypothetical protein ABI878_14405 [Acidobacteriota bacterium]
MALPTTPGKSYAFMVGLLNQYFSIMAPTPMTAYTMLAIFWEETMFNNIAQAESGTGVGFGQTEPFEFYRFDAKGSLSALAKKGNYLVDGLPRRNGKVLLGMLDDGQAVQVACALVRDLFERGIKSKQSIMNAYGGVGFTGPQPARFDAAGGRESVISGILNCEKALMAATTADEVLNALKIARPFNQDDVFKKILFP